MNAAAYIRLQFTSEKQLSALINALTPEIQKQISNRSIVYLARDAQVLLLSVEAQDTIALRAALNSYLRWINSTLNVLETLEDTLKKT
jgi:KEOPS complex subunit Pcc1